MQRLVVTNSPTKMQRLNNKNYVIVDTRKGDGQGSVEHGNYKNINYRKYREILNILFEKGKYLYRKIILGTREKNKQQRVWSCSEDRRRKEKERNYCINSKEVGG